MKHNGKVFFPFWKIKYPCRAHDYLYPVSFESPVSTSSFSMTTVVVDKVGVGSGELKDMTLFVDPFRFFIFFGALGAFPNSAFGAFGAFFFRFGAGVGVLPKFRLVRCSLFAI